MFTQTTAVLSAEIVAREPLGAAGASGNSLELVTLRDGRRLVRKEVSQEWDWISRATGDEGRVVRMVEQRLFERFPASLDPTVVAAERVGRRWSVFMRDVSAELIAADRRLGRTELRTILAALAELHLTFWGERTGTAPAPVELASFLVFDARRFDVPKDQVVNDARALYGDHWDERAFELALVGGLVQLGCNLTLPIALGKGDPARATAQAKLDWWVPRVSAALENQSL